MKKLLSTLGLLTLGTSTSLSVVACDSKDGTKIPSLPTINPTEVVTAINQISNYNLNIGIKSTIQDVKNKIPNSILEQLDESIKLKFNQSSFRCIEIINKSNNQILTVEDLKSESTIDVSVTYQYATLSSSLINLTITVDRFLKKYDLENFGITTPIKSMAQGSNNKLYVVSKYGWDPMNTYYSKLYEINLNNNKIEEVYNFKFNEPEKIYIANDNLYVKSMTSTTFYKFNLNNLSLNPISVTINQLSIYGCQMLEVNGKLYITTKTSIWAIDFDNNQQLEFSTPLKDGFDSLIQAANGNLYLKSNTDIYEINLSNNSISRIYSGIEVNGNDSNIVEFFNNQIIFYYSSDSGNIFYLIDVNTKEIVKKYYLNLDTFIVDEPLFKSNGKLFYADSDSLSEINLDAGTKTKFLPRNLSVEFDNWTVMNDKLYEINTKDNSLYEVVI